MRRALPSTPNHGRIERNLEEEPLETMLGGK
jgi:hypothetical protein